MDEETWMNAEKALQLGFVDGILFAENKAKSQPVPEEEPDETESEEETEKSEKTPDDPEKDKPENIQPMTFSASRSRDSFIQKVSAHANSVPIEQLEKRLNLLKF